VFTEDSLLPISALQHILFCPRQCALIHLEQVWADNQFTAEGNVMHKNAHDEHLVTRSGVRISHSLPVSSRKYGLSGQCDIVEFHKNGDIVPIEYKRGKPKSHRADEVQLCAQALCLEGMLGTTIPEAFIFYGQRKRRTLIPLNEELRTITCQTITDLHHLINSKITPPPNYIKKLCEACSLIDLCQPRATVRLQRGAKCWFHAMVSSDTETLST
jgi:CRISPR-associated exonuclease Cas4